MAPRSKNKGSKKGHGSNAAASTSNVPISTSNVPEEPAPTEEPPIATEFVDVYWDLNTCPLAYPADGIVGRIETALNEVNANSNSLRYALSDTRVICGNVNALSKEDWDSLQSYGFKLEPCEDRRAYCNNHNQGQRKPKDPPPDLELEVHLTDQSLNPVTTNILLISSDYHFGESMDINRVNGYTIFLALSGEIQGTGYQEYGIGYEEYGHYAWYWEWMEYDGTGLYTPTPELYYSVMSFVYYGVNCIFPTAVI
ncbi:unnamed protein product [Microthlaspi erraticum]|uniref:NYN domain-containing protein n=1 Tax=Microthlaspi erraticum TaxID=1685480 RepID=A0A6D2IV21_9BRAS|nr:unnamed protein product [Microthlaspi erraticum]